MYSLGCLLCDVCTLRCVVHPHHVCVARIQHSDNSVPKAKNFNSASDRLPNGKLSDYSPDLQRLIQDLLEDQVSLQLNGFSTALSNSNPASLPAREQPYLRPSQVSYSAPVISGLGAAISVCPYRFTCLTRTA
jgi:hypothetical protein